jgi:hypothetical protein
MKNWTNKNGGLFCGDTLMVFHYLSVSGSWPHNRGDLRWDCPCKVIKYISVICSSNLQVYWFHQLIKQITTKKLLKVASHNNNSMHYVQEYYKHELVLLWAQLTKIYPPLPTSVQPISITKTSRIVPTKTERDPPLFTGKLLIKFQNILRNTTQVIIQHRLKILFSVISSPINLERQKWKSSKIKGILLSSPVSCW